MCYLRVSGGGGRWVSLGRMVVAGVSSCRCIILGLVAVVIDGLFEG